MKNQDDLRFVEIQKRKILSEENFREVIEKLRSVAKIEPGAIFLLEHIPDQGEEFYTIVASGRTVHEIEVDRASKNIVEHKQCSLDDFKKRKLKILLRRRITEIEKLS